MLLVYFTVIKFNLISFFQSSCICHTLCQQPFAWSFCYGMPQSVTLHQKKKQVQNNDSMTSLLTESDLQHLKSALCWTMILQHVGNFLSTCFLEVKLQAPLKNNWGAPYANLRKGFFQWNQMYWQICPIWAGMHFQVPTLFSETILNMIVHTYDA